MELVILFLGIIGTQLIHCTWETGGDSLLCLILANNLGRGLLFILITFLGYWVSKHVDYIKRILISLITIYSTGFILNMAMEVVLGKTLGIKNIISQFVRGTPGNIWIIYGLIVFCVLIAIYKRINNPKIKQAIKLIGGGYSIVALCLFCYANTYSGIVSFDNGFILNVFYRVLGTNRSPYILGLPFMIFGGYLSTSDKHYALLKNKIYVPIVLFIMWCAEVIFMYVRTGNINIHMTFFGILFVASIFSFIKNYFDDAIDFNIYIMSILLFAIQYSTTQMCFALFDIETLPMRLMFFVVYIFFIITIFVICNRRKNV